MSITATGIMQHENHETRRRREDSEKHLLTSICRIINDSCKTNHTAYGINWKELKKVGLSGFSQPFAQLHDNFFCYNIGPEITCFTNPITEAAKVLEIPEKDLQLLLQRGKVVGSDVFMITIQFASEPLKDGYVAFQPVIKTISKSEVNKPLRRLQIAQSSQIRGDILQKKGLPIYQLKLPTGVDMKGRPEV